MEDEVVGKNKFLIRSIEHDNEGMKICIEGDNFTLDYNGIAYVFTKEEFNRKSREVMGKLLNIRKES